MGTQLFHKANQGDELPKFQHASDIYMHVLVDLLKIPVANNLILIMLNNLSIHSRVTCPSALRSRISCNCGLPQCLFDELYHFEYQYEEWIEWM